MPVERGKIKELALAIGDKNPIYVDAVAARLAGYRDITLLQEKKKNPSGC